MTRQRSIARMTRLLAPRALALLERVREACPDVPFTDPEDRSCDSDVRWGMDYAVDDTTGVGVDVEAHLSEECDGSSAGVNVGLHIVAFGGQIIGQCTPHNYTDLCWVRRNDLAAVGARMAELECVDVSGVQSMILEHLTP